MRFIACLLLIGSIGCCSVNKIDNRLQRIDTNMDRIDSLAAIINERLAGMEEMQHAIVKSEGIEFEEVIKTR